MCIRIVLSTTLLRPDVVSFPCRRWSARLNHFLFKVFHHQLNNAAKEFAHEKQKKKASKEQQNDPPESSARESWPPARSRPAKCRPPMAGGRRCSSMCRAGYWSSTPSSWCLGGRCRYTWPAAVRALAVSAVCPPGNDFFLLCQSNAPIFIKGSG